MDRISEAYKKMKGPVPSEKELEPFKADAECYEYAQAVKQKWPHLRYETGFYVKGNRASDHAWAIHPNGTIVDSTSSQFGKGSPMIIPPDHEHHGRYVSFERHPERAQVIAHLLGWHDEKDSGPVDECPHCNKSK